MRKRSTRSSKKYIVRDPEILGGTPVIAGTRVPISRILYLLKDGYTIDAISEEYPHIGKKKIEKAIEQAIKNLENPDAQAFL